MTQELEAFDKFTMKSFTCCVHKIITLTYSIVNFGIIVVSGIGQYIALLEFILNLKWMGWLLNIRFKVENI